MRLAFAVNQYMVVYPQPTTHHKPSTTGQIDCWDQSQGVVHVTIYAPLAAHLCPCAQLINSNQEYR